MEWTDSDACDSRYLVGLYGGETVRRYFGFHTAPETISLSREMGIGWDRISNYDWNARVTCAPAGGIGVEGSGRDSHAVGPARVGQLRK